MHVNFVCKGQENDYCGELGGGGGLGNEIRV